MSRQFKKIGLNLLIAFLQGIQFAARFVFAVISRYLLLPLYTILKLISKRPVISLYGHFIVFKSRFHFSKGARAAHLLRNAGTVHALIVMTALVVFVGNLTIGTPSTYAATELTPKPALFYLLQSDFPQDGDLIIETFSASQTITPEEETYLRNLASVRVQPFSGADDLAGTPEEDTIPQPAGRPAVPARTEIVTHTVQPGETISTIAQSYGISVSTILWENDLTAYSIIRPGDALRILPASGVAHEIKRGETLSSIAATYDVESDEILAYNNIDNAGLIQVGQKLIIPGASRQQARPAAPTQPSYSGVDVAKRVVTPIPPSAEPVGGNKMQWPTVGYTITQYFSWSHYALDIANKSGTAVYAADAGTVEVAGWGNGYGNQIVVDHGGGKKTRYAHASKLYVKVGDTVEKGQTIMAMGSTGRSTGPHVHFEVIINGTKYNPLDYVDYQR